MLLAAGSGRGRLHRTTCAAGSESGAVKDQLRQELLGQATSTGLSILDSSEPVCRFGRAGGCGLQPLVVDKRQQPPGLEIICASAGLVITDGTIARPTSISRGGRRCADTHGWALGDRSLEPTRPTCWDQRRCCWRLHDRRSAGAEHATGTQRAAADETVAAVVERYHSKGFGLATLAPWSRGTQAPRNTLAVYLCHRRPGSLRSPDLITKTRQTGK